MAAAKNHLMDIRVGIGYDVHPIVRGRRLRLGGIDFPAAGFSLRGHSDADVLVHALCDALLGAAGLPDIGRLFPNSDDRHAGRNSLEFLSEVHARLHKTGWAIVNVDATLLAERPKISPHIDRMRRRLAKAMDLNPARIGIKATTHEGLGAIGRGEGIAAMAVALLTKNSLTRTRAR